VACVVASGREDLTVQARSLGRHERPKPLRVSAEVFWSRPDPGVPLDALGGVTNADVYDDFCWIRARLHAAGVEHLLAANLSVAGLAPAAVVRVVIPDLETNSPFHCGTRARRVLLDDLLLT
jgi:ribosomal protein S12 methylthiotransferase accessory factor